MPWRARVARNSSCMTSTSWSMSTSGRSTVALSTAYWMIRSEKPCRARSRALASSRRLDVGAQLVERAELAEAGQEVVVDLGQDLLAELLDGHAEVGDLAGQAGLAVVLREGDVEVDGVVDLGPDEVLLEARDEPLLAQDDGHALGRAALERLAVAGAHEGHDRVVAVLGAAILDRRQRGVLVAQLLDDLVDPGVVDGLDLGREREVPVVAEGDLGADLDGGLEDDRLAFLGRDDLDVGVGQGQDVLAG